MSESERITNFLYSTKPISLRTWDDIHLDPKLSWQTQSNSYAESDTGQFSLCHRFLQCRGKWNVLVVLCSAEKMCKLHKKERKKFINQKLNSSYISIIKPQILLEHLETEIQNYSIILLSISHMLNHHCWSLLNNVMNISWVQIISTRLFLLIPPQNDL